MSERDQSSLKGLGISKRGQSNLKSNCFDNIVILR